LTAKVHWLDLNAEELRAASWMAQADAAMAHAERARLTGEYEDYVAADALLDRAFAIAPAGAGPFLERASLDFTLHRLPRIEPALAAAERAILVDVPTRAAILSLRADVALQRGRLEEARRGFGAALSLHASPTGLTRLASWQWESGDLEGAEATYRKAASMSHAARGSQRAWTHLQLGLMDLEAGRLVDAMAHYRDANAMFPGWWLIEEHIAEVLALQGQIAPAMRMYRDLIARTHNPEFMDALARIHRARGEDAEAERWIQEARSIHTPRMELFPEAAWGHALDHFLEFGTAAEAVDLAKKNFALRPNRKAREQLVRAYEKSGRHDTARRLAAEGDFRAARSVEESAIMNRGQTAKSTSDRIAADSK
jgi:tetratricopeptide (TPR) repeat protein